jgi:hypothetical protein
MNIPGLQQSVVDGLPDIFAKWEGPRLPYMYTDVKGIVTCATGNALFTAAAAEALAWVNPDGSPCSKAQVDAAYAAVKAAYPKVQSTACARLTTIRLTPAAITGLIDRTIAADWGYLCAQYGNAKDLPADAQLMLLSSSWAWGSYFANVWDRIGAMQDGTKYGAAFKMCLARGDFKTAGLVVRAASAHEEGINPGIIPRDLAEVAMLLIASAVTADGADPSVLWYPRMYKALPPAAPAAAAAAVAMSLNATNFHDSSPPPVSA